MVIAKTGRKNMNKHIRSWLAGTTMLVMTATGAFAEVVLNRGNSADPESLDPHKTSTVYEANILPTPSSCAPMANGLMEHR